MVRATREGASSCKGALETNNLGLALGIPWPVVQNSRRFFCLRLERIGGAWRMAEYTDLDIVGMGIMVLIAFETPHDTK